jgi:hypothetical protein
VLQFLFFMYKAALLGERRGYAGRPLLDSFWRLRCLGAKDVLILQDIAVFRPLFFFAILCLVYETLEIL